MAERSADRLASRDLSATVAETIFGWKDLRRIDGKLVGKKPDQLGRWRSATVPDYAADMRQAKAIEERMSRLGREKQYAKQLAKLTAASQLPLEWATPELRARAALQAIRFKPVK